MISSPSPVFKVVSMLWHLSVLYLFFKMTATIFFAKEVRKTRFYQDSKGTSVTSQTGGDKLQGRFLVSSGFECGRE